MKKIITAVLLIACTSMAMAGGIQKVSARSYNGDLINVTGLAYSTTYVMDLATYDADRVSAEVDFSTTAFTTGSFYDGQVSTGIITIVSTAGLAGEYITINNIRITAAESTTTAHNTFQVLNNTTNTARNLAFVISTNPYLSPIVLAQSVGAVVTATSTVVGGKYALTTSAASKISVSSSSLLEGKPAYYSSTTDIIRIPSHGFTLGLPVLYTAGAAIGGLTSLTTYYVMPITSDTLYLARTSTDALVGNDINLTTQRADIAQHTFTLAPLSVTGDAGFYWEKSNDGVDYYSASASSVTFTSVKPTGSPAAYGVQNWDFSTLNYRYLRLNVVQPTTGGVTIKATINAKQ